MKKGKFLRDFPSGREREREEKKRCELLTVVWDLLSVEEVEPSTVLDICCVVQGVYGRRAVEALT